MISRKLFRVTFGRDDLKLLHRILILQHQRHHQIQVDLGLHRKGPPHLTTPAVLTPIHANIPPQNLAKYPGQPRSDLDLRTAPVIHGVSAAREGQGQEIGGRGPGHVVEGDALVQGGHFSSKSSWWGDQNEVEWLLREEFLGFVDGTREARKVDIDGGANRGEKTRNSSV